MRWERKGHWHSVDCREEAATGRGGRFYSLRAVMLAGSWAHTTRLLLTLFRMLENSTSQRGTITAGDGRLDTVGQSWGWPRNHQASPRGSETSSRAESIVTRTGCAAAQSSPAPREGRGRRKEAGGGPARWQGGAGLGRRCTGGGAAEPCRGRVRSSPERHGAVREVAGHAGRPCRAGRSGACRSPRTLSPSSWAPRPGGGRRGRGARRSWAGTASATRSSRTSSGRTCSTSGTSGPRRRWPRPSSWAGSTSRCCWCRARRSTWRCCGRAGLAAPSNPPAASTSSAWVRAGERPVGTGPPRGATPLRALSPRTALPAVSVRRAAGAGHGYRDAVSAVGFSDL